MKQVLTIRAKLTALLVSFAAVLLLALGLLAYPGGRHYLYQAAVTELLATAIEKEAALEQWRQEREADLTALAGLQNLRR